MPKHFNLIFVLIWLSFINGCSYIEHKSNWQQSFRNCPISGQAYYSGIPLASREEHQQAELFTPADSSNCMLYVVRSDYSGSKISHAYIFLYKQGTEPPELPADNEPWFGDPQWSARFLLETSREQHKAEIISREVYAAWELSPGTYVMDASIIMWEPFARVTLQCDAGHTFFWKVAPNNIFQVKVKLHEISPDDGKALIRGQLRSIGMQPGGPFTPGRIIQHECQ